jgi:hypothetical protein
MMSDREITGVLAASRMYRVSLASRFELDTRSLLLESRDVDRGSNR